MAKLRTDFPTINLLVLVVQLQKKRILSALRLAKAIIITLETLTNNGRRAQSRFSGLVVDRDNAASTIRHCKNFMYHTCIHTDVYVNLCVQLNTILHRI